MNESKNGLFIITGITKGQSVKLKRVSLGWRIIDLASRAKVSSQDVTNLEHDCYIRITTSNRILFQLALPLILPGTVTGELANSIDFPKEKDRYLHNANEVLLKYIKSLEDLFGMEYTGETIITEEDVKTAFANKQKTRGY